MEGSSRPESRNPPNLLRLRAELTIDQMRAYVMDAFTPEMVGGALDAALEGAVARLPNSIASEVDAAVRDTVQKAVREAINPYTLHAEIAKSIRPTLLRVIAREYMRAATRAEKEGNADA